MKKLTKHFVAAALASFMLTGAYGTASAATSRTTQRQTTCSNASYMSDFIRNESRRFSNGKYWNGGGDSGITSKPSTNTSIENKFTADRIYVSRNFFYNVDSRDLSSTLCEGFARKLSYDYYGTKTFLVLYNVSYDDIKPGDIVGFKNSRTSTSGHAIFVLSVSGDTITFADCNGDSKCGIRWGAKISKKSLGTLERITRPFMVGDTNFDGVVDKSDLGALNAYIENSSSLSGYENRAINRSGDINNDGEINTVDYNLLMSYVDPCIPSDKYAVSQYFCYVIDK